MTQLSSRIISHYERHATSWDADRQNSAWNDKIWHDLFLANLERWSNSGPWVRLRTTCAQHMADLGFRVTGVDSSLTMISLCRSRLPNHKWIVRDMRELSLKPLQPEM